MSRRSLIPLLTMLVVGVAVAQWEPDVRLTNDPASSYTSFNNAWCVAAGEHRAAWSGRDEQGRAVAAGVYFCRLQTPDAAAVDRVVLLR
jgi:hypothetical protein